MNQQLLTAFFEDLARAMDYWVDAVAKAVDDPQASSPWMEDREPFERLHATLGGRVDDLRPVLAEGMRGLLNSVLTMIDGGTASAEVGRVELTEADGPVLAEGSTSCSSTTSSTQDDCSRSAGLGRAFGLGGVGGRLR